MLSKITLDNFQGIRHLEIPFLNGNGVKIYGANATGKTTIANAFAWLLFGSASTGAKGFTPQTKDENGDGKHNTEHSVSAELEDGTALKKVYHEVYKKKRGSAEGEFSGFTTDYYINSVPVKEKEFDSKIEEIFGDKETAKILTNPTYFSEMLPWEKRREILLEVTGEVSDEEIFNSSENMKKFREIIGKVTPEEYEKQAKAREREINKELDSLPGRIDEARRAIPDLSGIDEGGLSEEAALLTRETERLISRKAEISAEGEAAEISRQIAEIEVEILKENGKFYSGRNLVKLGELEKAAQDKGYAIGRIEYEIADYSEYLQSLEVSREMLLREYAEVSAKVWDNSSENCPTCGQALPKNKIDELKAEFNLRKSHRLEEINAKGKRTCSKEMIAQQKKLISEANERLAKAKEEQDKAKKEYYSFLEAQNTGSFEDSEIYKEFVAKKAALEGKKGDCLGRAKERTAEIDARLAEIEVQKKSIAEGYALLAAAKTQQARVKELTQTEKILCEEFGKLEQGLYLCGEFTKKKVASVTEKADSHFQNVRFRLFSTQINGGIKEECEVLIPSAEGNLVPYAFANNAARVNAGLEIIEVLQKHYGKKLPVFIDNAESVTDIRSIDAQMIKLIVSANDRVLRVV